VFAFKYSTVIPGAALPPSPPSEGRCNNCIHWWIEVTMCLWFNVERFLCSGWLFQLLHWRSLSRSTYELLLWCKLPPIWRLLQWCTQWLPFCRCVADIYNLPNMFTWSVKKCANSGIKYPYVSRIFILGCESLTSKILFRWKPCRSSHTCQESH